MARDDIAFWGKVRADPAPDAAINRTRRRLIETAEKQLADQRALAQMAEQQIAAAQARFVKLTHGERAVGDTTLPHERRRRRSSPEPRAHDTHRHYR